MKRKKAEEVSVSNNEETKKQIEETKVIQLDKLFVDCIVLCHKKEQVLISSGKALAAWLASVHQPKDETNNAIVKMSEKRLRSLGKQHAIGFNVRGDPKYLVLLKKDDAKSYSSSSAWEIEVENALKLIGLKRQIDYVTESDLRQDTKRQGPTPDILFHDHVIVTYRGQRIKFIDAKSGYLSKSTFIAGRDRKQAARYSEFFLQRDRFGLFVCKLGCNSKVRDNMFDRFSIFTVSIKTN